MAKPAPVEPVETRIMELTARHIRSVGPKRVTIVAIAEEAGMSHANIYRYFPSKKALFDAVTDYWLRPIETSLHEITDSPDPAYDKLERLLSAMHRAYRDKLEEDERLFQLFADAAVRSTGIARRHRNRIQGEIQRVIDEGMASGAFVADNQLQAVALVIDSLFRFIHPVGLSLDRGMQRSVLTARFERALHHVLQSMTRGVG